MDLRKQYQQYLDQTYTPEQKKNDPSLQYRLSSLYKVNGAISECFEMYMQPYVDKEEKDLSEPTLDELRHDLQDPIANSLETEGVKILNSSMLMFSKIKHLLKRASSISKGQTMFSVFNVVRRVVTRYIDQVKIHFGKEFKNTKKNEKDFILKTCIFINTVDYIKETLGTVSDLVVTLVSDPFGDKIDFSEEEELGLAILNEMVNGIKTLVESTIDSSISSFMSKISWEKFESGVSEASMYVVEIRERLQTVVGNVRGNISDVYMTKLLNTICSSTNKKFIAAVLKMKKISDMGIQQLLCGKFSSLIFLDFTEIKNSLHKLGKDENGEIFSRLYTNYVNKTSQKTTAIIKMLGINNAQLLDHLENFKKTVSIAEIEKVLTIKGFKKNEINKIIAKF